MYLLLSTNSPPLPVSPHSAVSKTLPPEVSSNVGFPGLGLACHMLPDTWAICLTKRAFILLSGETRPVLAEQIFPLSVLYAVVP